MKKEIEGLAGEGVREFKGIFGRFKRRDFSGNTGQAVKNSAYQFSTNVVAKLGSLVFTAIIARILLPDLFGLYSLALSTIIFFSAFSDLGLDTAMITFVSKTLGAGQKNKAKSYFRFISKLKIIATFAVSLLLLLLAYFLSNNYYQKPIFLALLAGGLYIPLSNLSKFLEWAFTASNNFKTSLIKEVIFQISRLLFIPLALMFLDISIMDDEILVLLLILILSACYGISAIYLILKSKKSLPFLGLKSKKLSFEEEKRVKSFVLPLTVTALSGIFFGYIDMFMLGRYIPSEYIGYYGAAFSLVSSAMILLNFAIVAVYPIFTKLSGEGLERAFRKVYLFSFLISFVISLISFFLAEPFLTLIYGEAFSKAIVFFRFLLPVLVIGTLTSVYSSYFTAREKTSQVAIPLIWATIINIVLNYLFIKWGLKTSIEYAVIGACIATIISKVFYLVSLHVFKKSEKIF